MGLRGAWWWHCGGVEVPLVTKRRRRRRGAGGAAPLLGRFVGLTLRVSRSFDGATAVVRCCCQWLCGSHVPLLLLSCESDGLDSGGVRLRDATAVFGC